MVARPLGDLNLPPEFTQKPSPRRRLRALVPIAALVLASAAYLATHRHKEQVYRSSPVERRSLTRVVEATGRLELTMRVEVPAPVPGRLTKILAKAGAAVEQDQPLAELDDESARTAVSGARASLGVANSRVAEAVAARDEAVETRRRTEKLAERGLASAADLASARSAATKAEAALRGARSEVDAATASLSTARYNERSLVLRAPVAGTLAVAPEWPGGAVTPERGPLFVIGNDVGTLRLDASLTEADIGLVHAGQNASFSVPAFPDRSFQATVETRAIEPQRGNGAPSYPVVLRAANPERLLLPGMTTTVRIEVAHAHDVITVREAALRFSPEDAGKAPLRSRIWKLDRNQRLVAVPVKAGISDGAYTEVEPVNASSLSVGEAVVIGLESNGETGGPGVSLGGGAR